jgi:hypothetical protein
MPKLVIKHPYNGIEIPAETPFQPVVGDYGTDAKVRFNHGYVYDWVNVAGGEPKKWVIDGIEEDYTANGKFFILIVREKNEEGEFEVVSASLVTSFIAGEDTDDTETRAIMLCELDQGSVKEAGVRENIHFFSGSGETAFHQWKIIKTDDLEVSVEAGVVTDKGEVYEIEKEEELEVYNGAYVLLKIPRGSNSRDIGGDDVDNSKAIEIYVDDQVPESSEETQYIPLGQIETESKGGEHISKIIQLKFEEIHIKEVMIVEDGEFKLADFLMAGRNSYDRPT